MYDNSIQHLENGTFDGLKNLQTLHLARNPFHCSCYLNWLTDWLNQFQVETSGVRCESPKKLHKKKIVSLLPGHLVCEEQSKLAIRSSHPPFFPDKQQLMGTILTFK